MTGPGVSGVGYSRITPRKPAGACSSSKSAAGRSERRSNTPAATGSARGPVSASAATAGVIGVNGVRVPTRRNTIQIPRPGAAPPATPSASSGASYGRRIVSAGGKCPDNASDNKQNLLKTKQLLEEAVSDCEKAFEASSAPRCQAAVQQMAAALARASGRCLASVEAARFCAMLAALLQHPHEGCREAVVASAARALDCASLLRVAPKALCSNQLDNARRLQVVEAVFRACRIVMSADPAALERCRLGGGLFIVVDVWRQRPGAPDLAREGAQLLLLFARGHPKAVAAAGGAECAVASWQKLTLPPAAEGGCVCGPALSPRGPGAGVDATPDGALTAPPSVRGLAERGAAEALLEAALKANSSPPKGCPAVNNGSSSAPPSERQTSSPVMGEVPPGLQLYIELLSVISHHAPAARLMPVIPSTLQALTIFATHGSVRALAVTLQLISKLSQDVALARELVRAEAPELVLGLLDVEALTQQAATRRAVANAWVQLTVMSMGEQLRKQLPNLARGSDDDNALPAAASNVGRLSPALGHEVATKSMNRNGPVAALHSANACAAALKRRLLRLGQQLQSANGSGGSIPQQRVLVYPSPAGQLPASAIFVMECSGEDLPLLSFDAAFEGGNLRAAWALPSATEYELQLSVDLANPAHVQWFNFKVARMLPNVEYTFHLVNLSKPTSLFEEGAQPVVLSRRRLLEKGVGWVRDGHDIAYYASGSLLHSGKAAYNISFSLQFPYADDEVCIAHCFPYNYSDLRRDISLWSAGKAAGRRVQTAPEDNAKWHIERRQLLQTMAGLAVDTFCVGAPAGTKPMALLIGRAHPGETPGSWAIRGACDFLLGDACAEAVACREAVTWVLVPMLNPDGVVVGNTRTNLGGVDLNRHHHDGQAQETCALRALVQAATAAADGAGPPMVFVDFHAHSRRNGNFVMGNAGGSARLPALLAKRSQIFDLAGSSMLGCNSGGKDAGVGRVAMFHCGIPHSFTLEMSFGASHASTEQLQPHDLEGLGRDVCMAIRDLATSENENPALEVQVASLMSGGGGGDG
eukprot:TRINITY_DN50326_c0_g2_i1.p1 TRINITY_DN50326_c0_g2~~TRINITY_DN50326_c0_g2_i1.p1  ORF type:complete len:1044 (+),score=228.30 TRINITY_DN50326_c0_g2_i1:117-3248(+)